MRRLKLLNLGNILLKTFMVTLTIFVILFVCLRNSIGAGLIVTGILIGLLEFIVFWAGIILVYTTSIQLGIKTRIIGALAGWIPVVHLIMLGKIVKITSDEYKYEINKIKTNEKRQEKQICKTKYPILLVHGVFFRDFKYLNYWGRVPKELEQNGATLFYGNQNSASSVDDSAKELAKRIEQIIKETGAEKINVIAHSKGGLDSRTAISKYGADKYVASLTTINTPHRGCEFADYILNKIPVSQKEAIASAYNKAATKIGDVNPDFIAAVTDLTYTSCEKRNQEITDSSNVFYQSFGSKMEKAKSGQFPLNIATHLVGLFDGANDGLVGTKSFSWGSKYTFLEPKGKRGISHGDVIDLNRENIKGFDVRELYVGIVSDLKERGF